MLKSFESNLITRENFEENYGTNYKLKCFATEWDKYRTDSTQDR
jgi:hypothetical protein